MRGLLAGPDFEPSKFDSTEKPDIFLKSGQLNTIWACNDLRDWKAHLLLINKELLFCCQLIAESYVLNHKII